MKKYILAAIMSVVTMAWAADSASLFEIETKWKDQTNQDFQLKNNQGYKTIIGMIYTSCPHACPMTISKIKSIEKEINKGIKYKIVLASFDVKKDTPQNLLKQMKLRKLDQTVWKLLSPDTDEKVRELSLVLGISYKDLGNGDFSHSNVLTLLDEQGNKISSLEGLNSEHQEFVNKINGTK